MVQSKTQLVAVANEWMEHAKADMREQMIAFMRQANIREDQMASILDVPQSQISAILNGSGEINLNTFARILVAADMAAVIMPARDAEAMCKMQKQDFQDISIRMRKGQRNGSMESGYPMPPKKGLRSTEPMRDSRGRFTSTRDISMENREALPMEDSMPQPLPSLEDLSYDKLSEIMYMHGWNREVDMRRMSRGQMVSFLIEKFSSAPSAKAPTTIENESCRPHCENEQCQTSDTPISKKIMNGLKEVFDENPHLLDKLASLFNEE